VSGKDSQAAGSSEQRQRYEALEAAYRNLQGLYDTVRRERGFYKAEFEKFQRIKADADGPVRGPLAQAPPSSSSPRATNGGGTAAAAPVAAAGASGEDRRFQQEVVMLSRTVQRLELQLADAHADIAALERERESLLNSRPSALQSNPPTNSKQGAVAAGVTASPAAAAGAATVDAQRASQQAKLLEAENDRLRSELVGIRDYASQSASQLERLIAESDAKLRRAEDRAELAEAMLQRARADGSGARRMSASEAGEQARPGAVAATHASDVGATGTHGSNGVRGGGGGPRNAPPTAHVGGADDRRGMGMSVADLRVTLRELDAERDSLQTELDERAVEYDRLQHM
jgi:hypothetical protein